MTKARSKLPEIQLASIRASSTPRFRLCPGSAFMKQQHSTNPAARLGTAAHVLAASIVNGRHKSFEDVAKLHDVPLLDLRILYFNGCTLWERMSAFYPEAQAEVDLLPHQINCGSAIGTLTGTADIVSVLPGEIRVADWKSGWADGEHGAQLMTYALLAWKMHANPESINRVYSSIFWMRSCETEGAWYSTDLLSEWEQMLTLKLAEGAAGIFVPGEACEHCYVKQCPAFNDTLAWALDENTVPDENSVVKLHYMRKAMESRAKVLSGGVKHIVLNSGPVDAGEGRKLQFKERVVQEIDPVAAWDKIVGKVGLDAALQTISIGKGALEQAVKAQVESGKGKAVEEFNAELKALGALNNVVSVYPDIVKQEGENVNTNSE